jgi:hypothetical protein
MASKNDDGAGKRKEIDHDARGDLFHTALASPVSGVPGSGLDPWIPCPPASLRTPLRRMLTRLWQWSRASFEERRMTRARTRFWAELRAGEREAEDRSRVGGDSDLRTDRKSQAKEERGIQQ